MDSQEFRSLQEAYLEVIENQQLNEGYKNFPYDKVKAKAKKLAPGRDDLGREPLTAPKAPNTPQKDLNRATKLRLATHLHHSEGPKQKEKINKGPESLLYKKRSKTVSDSYNYYDIILSHLLDEGYAETPKAAEAIMVNMSEEWKEEIVEARDDDAREMRRLAAAERRAGNSDRMDAKTASKYAGSEAQSAARADKKSKGKHIHGMTDSYETNGDLVDEGYKEIGKEKESAMYRRAGNLARTSLVSKGKKKEEAQTKSAKIVSAITRQKENERFNRIGQSPLHNKEQLELQLRAHLRERALDASETKEKESVYKAIKPSKLAKSYPEKSPKELKSLRYAISTNQAKKNMDTSRSDKRYGVEK